MAIYDSGRRGLRNNRLLRQLFLKFNKVLPSLVTDVHLILTFMILVSGPLSLTQIALTSQASHPHPLRCANFMSKKKPKPTSAKPPPEYVLVSPAPLSEADLDELEAFLDSNRVGPNTMRIDALHGFATAILIGPESILPSVWIPHVWGPTADDEPAWKDDKQFARIMEMIFSLCNEIVERFEIAGEEFEPLLLEGEYRGEKYLAGEQWAAAFIEGTKFWSHHFDALLAQPEAKALEPIVKLARATFWVTPAGYHKGIKKRQTYVAQLPASVATLRDYFMPIRLKILDEQLALEAAQPVRGKLH